MKKFIVLAVLTLGPSFASTIAMMTSGGDVGSNEIDSFTTGWSFTISDALAVTSLGYYDAGEDGLASSHDVGIFDSSGTLLLSATVPSSTAGTLNNGFRMVSITPFNLLPGDYVIGGFSDRSLDAILVDSDFIPATGITIIDSGVYDYGSTLAAPLASTEGDSYASVNFEFTDVPEPGTLLLSLVALIAMGLKKASPTKALKPATPYGNTTLKSMA